MIEQQAIDHYVQVFQRVKPKAPTEGQERVLRALMGPIRPDPLGKCDRAS